MTSFLFKLFLFFIFVRLGLSIERGPPKDDGIATIYNPEENVGYCGKQYSKTDNVVAMPKDFFDTGPCNTTIDISRRRKGETTLTVVRGIVGDMCVTCEPNHINISPNLFNQLQNPGESEIKVHWRLP